MSGRLVDKRHRPLRWLYGGEPAIDASPRMETDRRSECQYRPLILVFWKRAQWRACCPRSGFGHDEGGGQLDFATAGRLPRKALARISAGESRLGPCACRQGVGAATSPRY